MFNPWFFLFFKTVQLGFEAQSVIALRMMRFGAGRHRATRSPPHDCRQDCRRGRNAGGGGFGHRVGSPGCGRRGQSPGGTEKAGPRQQAATISQVTGAASAFPRSGQTPPAVAHGRKRSSRSELQSPDLFKCLFAPPAHCCIARQHKRIMCGWRRYGPSSPQSGDDPTIWWATRRITFVPQGESHDRKPSISSAEPC